jgi:hypothetical protein
MTTTAPQQPASNDDPTTSTTTQQLTIKTDEATETDTTPTRSKPAHRGITIRGSAPAFGRRPLTAAFKIVSGWSGC